MNTNGAPARAGLSAILVALAVLLALQLPSSGFTGRGNSTAPTPYSSGELLVSVTLENGSLVPAPLRGVQVGVSQLVLHGLHLVLPTNGTGEVEVTLPPGAYGVAVSNDKFAQSSDVSVYSGGVTRMNVTVDRTTYVASFVDAEDSTSQGEIEPWNTVVVEVAPYLVILATGAAFGEQVATNLSPPTFNDTVFLQPLLLYPDDGGVGFPGFVAGAEVQATVVSQVARSGGVWLTLRPTGVLQLAGSAYLQVVSYDAGSSVSVENG
jgi:hypothetical protein